MNQISRSLVGAAVALSLTRQDIAEIMQAQLLQVGVAVQPTVAGLRAHRDEVLEKAVEVLANWSRYEKLTAYSRPQVKGTLP